MTKLKDLTGQKFGRLTVIKRVENDKNGSTRWLCLCDCGNYKEVLRNSLINGTTKSCGCLHKESISKRATKHGLRHHRLYSIYHSMKKRCYNKNNSQYYRYGGRGITMCDEWKNDFMSFYNWAINNGFNENEKIFNCTLDRINNDGNYEPNNCRWVDMKTQSNNRSSNVYVEFNNKIMTLKQLADELDVKFVTLKYAIENRNNKND